MKITNELGLPEPFVEAAKSDHVYTDKRYSATAVLKGTREAILQRRHADEIETDAADMVWAIFGSAVHQILENSQETSTQLQENWLSVDMPNGYALSGIFDLYDDSTGTVTDYKTASVWKVQMGDYSDWRDQTLIYCWMLRQIGFNARRGEIVAMLKDHSKRKATVDPEYPQHPVIKVSWLFTDEDFKDIERRLIAKFDEIEEAEKLPDEELPLCTPEQRWAKPEKFAVKKRGNKRALKLWKRREEAEADAESRHLRDGKDYEVERRPGEDTKCEGYCSARAFCTYWKEKEDAR